MGSSSGPVWGCPGPAQPIQGQGELRLGGKAGLGLG